MTDEIHRFFVGIETVNDVILAILIVAGLFGLVFVVNHFWWKKYGR